MLDLFFNKLSQVALVLQSSMKDTNQRDPETLGIQGPCTSL